jgi:hypothetical protein
MEVIRHQAKGKAGDVEFGEGLTQPGKKAKTIYVRKEDRFFAMTPTVNMIRHPRDIESQWPRHGVLRPSF